MIILEKESKGTKMKNMFLTNSVKYITKYSNNYTDIDLEKIKYGLEGIYLTITKLIIIIILSIIFDILKPIILVLIFLNIIRYPAFGMHADKSSTCLISSIIFIFGLTFTISKFNINIYVKSAICILCFIDYLIFAPADTIKRPLTNAKKRKYRKLAASILSVTYIIMIFIIKNQLIVNTLFTSLIIEAILINPITYRLFKMPFNNYKNC